MAVKLIAREYETYEAPGGAIRRVSVWQVGRSVRVHYERGGNQGYFREDYDTIIGAGPSLALAIRRAKQHPLADADVCVCLDIISAA